MKVNRSVKQQIMELVQREYEANPGAMRAEVCDRIMDSLENADETLKERVAEESPRHLVYDTVSEYIRRSRQTLRRDMQSGQQVDPEHVAKMPTWEVVAKAWLTFKIGASETGQKLAKDCTLAEVRSARAYYAEQGQNMLQRERWCAALEEAMETRELSENDSVWQLYRAS